jgi:uncharacterized glyoxalase superfamily protein PhnB
MAMHLQFKDFGIVTRQLEQTRDFYVQHLGFNAVFSSDWYYHLKNGPLEIGVMKEGAESMPETLRAPYEGNGLWLSFEVEDVDAEYARLTTAGARVDGPPEDKPWGERCFIVRDPNGLALNLSKTIPPSPEFLASLPQDTAV